jgi:hypothetical protein
MKPNLNTLALRIDQINSANGFAIDITDHKDLCMRAALVASEASEALDEYDMAWRTREPRALGETIYAVQTELADVMIRALHLIYALGGDSNALYVFTPREPIGPRDAALLQPPQFHAAVAKKLVQPAFKAMELLRKGVTPERVQEALGQLMHVVANGEGFSEQLEPAMSIWAVIDAKLEKNAKRGFRHGGKVV